MNRRTFGVLAVMGAIGVLLANSVGAVTSSVSAATVEVEPKSESTVVEADYGSLMRGEFQAERLPQHPLTSEVCTQARWESYTVTVTTWFIGPDGTAYPHQTTETRWVYIPGGCTTVWVYHTHD
ncbi:MAG: hypothetical protein OXG42_00490 [Chloroflexi bacterium]|nr:hypothetical protein [Chloroflexota bacterium]